MTTLIFIVDLSRYDKGLFESIVLFNSLVNNVNFMRTSIILLLVNYRAFKRKIFRTPLSNYFPDYSGGCDGVRAEKYIRQRFEQCNRARLRMYTHVIEVDDTCLKRLTIAAVQETLLLNGLTASGIL
ncbi:guanine nucleotide binding protein, alpha subunit [Phaeosphaeriaceae sp. PMI808]|nr:guanine nucleotide binding protein, alpha subunit [Phaeosphaeriaceae sp. PMI808]